MSVLTLRAFRDRKEWKFFAVLPRADRRLAVAWWLALALRGVLPAVLAVAGGVVIGALERGEPLVVPLAFVGGTFVVLQILAPIHQVISVSLGDRTAAWLYDRLTEACVRPPGMAHLEDPSLITDLAVARDFDLGMTGPPLSISLDFIAGGLVELIAGIASALVLFAYAWWAPLVLAGAWIATHWLLRESAVWRDRNTAEVRAAQRDAHYAYRLAVDAAPAKELRLFGLADWTLARFVSRHPTTKMLALAFLVMIGLALVADGFAFHIPRGYIYSSMAFAGIVEVFNVLARRNRARNAARTKRQGMRERHQ